MHRAEIGIIRAIFAVRPETECVQDSRPRSAVHEARAEHGAYRIR